VQQPRDLLRLIPGIELSELRAPERCCGSAGVYNIVQNETAEQVLQAKMDDIAQALGFENGRAPADDLPRVIVSSNTGCHMQLIHGVISTGLDVPVQHVMDLMDAAYLAEDVEREANLGGL
jgi:glycolate oxidase iron-sulfur subunit